MKMSVWSSFFLDLSPEDMVKAFVSKGWQYSELSTEHAEQLLSRGRPAVTGAAFLRYADEAGLAFPQGHLWLTCDIAGHDRENVVENLKPWLDLFLAAKIDLAVLHPGSYVRYAAGDDPDEIEAACVESLIKLADYLKGTSLVICLENLFSHARSSADLQRIIRAAGGKHLAICLDTGHLNLAGLDQTEFIKQSGSLLKALHITDNEGERDQHMIPYGIGNIKWDQVVRSLKAIGYNGLFNYEIPGDNRAPLAVRLAKLDYLRNLSEYFDALT